MEHIELTPATLQEIMEPMTPAHKKIFEKLVLQVASIQPIQQINKWLNLFERDCPIDNLIARIIVQVICEIGNAIPDDMAAKKKAGIEEYSGHEAAIVAIREVRKIADTLEGHLSHEGCSQCIGTTH